MQVLDGFDNLIDGNLGMVAIFWNTHRGALQGKGLNKDKLYVGTFTYIQTYAYAGALQGKVFTKDKLYGSAYAYI
jgi:hypothetical protein